MRKEQFMTRSLKSELKTRAEPETEEMIIEGYFAVFGVSTELFPGAYEKIDPEACNKSMGNDIRALVNHDTTLVLGRNKSGTLELKPDSHGLYGRIKINRNDTDAVNCYERVKRGDVDQCSFGFYIVKEEEEWREDGTVEWTLKEVDVHEVTVCTFPAYEETGVSARSQSIENYKKRQLAVRKNEIKEKLKYVKTANDQ